MSLHSRFLRLILFISFLSTACVIQVPINSNPNGAAVKVDGESKGNTPLIVSLTGTQSHYVELSKEGYYPERVDIISTNSGFGALAPSHLSVTLQAIEGYQTIPAAPGNSPKISTTSAKLQTAEASQDLWAALNRIEALVTEGELTGEEAQAARYFLLLQVLLSEPLTDPLPLVEALFPEEHTEKSTPKPTNDSKGIEPVFDLGKIDNSIANPEAN